MIIKGKPLGGFLFKLVTFVAEFILKRRFNKIVIDPVEIKTGHSYLLMCNHFSFLDGILAYYICKKVLSGQGKMKTFQVMAMKEQLKKRKWLKHLGAFSVAPGRRSINESLSYAREVLSTPGRLLLLYPQGNLESLQVRKIVFQDGINEIVPKMEGNCQLIWTSVVIEYFESTKPSLYFSMLDCGTNTDFNFDQLVQTVNTHHQAAIKRQFRFTTED